MHRFLATVSLLLVAGAGIAQTKYVSDELEVTMRTGPSTRNAIVRILKSGTRLQVLEEDTEAGYSKVETAGGTEGWVLTRFLINQPVARDRLATAERQVQELRQQLSARSEELSGVRNELQETERNLEDSESANTNMAAELTDIRSASANAISLRDQNKSLRQRTIDVERQMEELLTTNRELRSRSNREWFVIGAAVLVVGIVLGLLLPRLKIKRRSSWGDF